jgi:predicted RNase H-like HicB family nuclease
MSVANYARIEDDTWFGEIPGFEGLWANAGTREACEAELEEALRDWANFRLSMRLPLPSVTAEDLAAA